MKKLFFFFGALVLSLSANALTIPVWQGSQSFSSWGQSVDVRSDISAQLAAGDRLVIHVTELATSTDNWRPIVLRQNSAVDDPSYDQFNVTETGNFIIAINSALAAKYTAGFNITGDKVTIDRIDYIKLNSSESETFWSGSSNLDWGTTYITVTASQGQVLTANDELIINLSGKYKSGEGEWLKVFLHTTNGAEISGTTIELGEAVAATCPSSVKYILTPSLASALQGGFRVSGFGVTATDVVLLKAPQSGDERVLWEGSESLSWGTGAATQDAAFSSVLANGDQIIVTVTAKGGSDWPKVYVRGASTEELGTVLVNKVSSFPYEAKITLTSAMLADLKEGKLSISGDDVTISKVVLHKDAFYNPAKEITLWSGSVTNINWSGTQPRTKEDLSISFANIRVGDAIKVYVGKNTTENAGWQLKNTSDWSEISGASGTVNKYGFFTYVITDEVTASDIRENGVILSGEGTYEAIQIALVKAERMVVDDMYDPSFAFGQHTGTLDNFTLNRTFYCDGYFNTICLPFCLATLDGTPLEGATVMQLNSASINAERDELDLMVLPVTSMNAGQPYLISFPAEEDDITSMTFHNVNISAPTPQIVTKQALKMVGTYAPTELSYTYDMLFLGNANTLYWSDNTESLKGFRAYFDTNVGAGAPRRGMVARIVAQENITTDLSGTNSTNGVEKKIVNGQLIIIRNGVQYSILGTK